MFSLLIRSQACLTLTIFQRILQSGFNGLCHAIALKISLKRFETCCEHLTLLFISPELSYRHVLIHFRVGTVLNTVPCGVIKDICRVSPQCTRPPQYTASADTTLVSLTLQHTLIWCLCSVQFFSCAFKVYNNNQAHYLIFYDAVKTQSATKKQWLHVFREANQKQQ